MGVRMASEWRRDDTINSTEIITANLHDIKTYALIVGSTLPVERDVPRSGGGVPYLSYLPDRRYVLPVIRDILHGCELFLDRLREAGVLQYVSEPLVSGAKRVEREFRVHSTLVALSPLRISSRRSNRRTGAWPGAATW